MKITIQGTIGYQKPVLQNLSLTISEGKMTCILGANGSGKTTLLLSIAGILPLINGEIRYEPDTTKLYTPPDPPYLPTLRVGDVILHYLTENRHLVLYKDMENPRLEKAEKILKELGFDKSFGNMYEELSTGEKMKVLLAGAIASDKKVLLMDEPNNHLDIKARLKLYTYLRKQARQKIVILTIHDINEAVSYCEQTILIIPQRRILGPDHPSNILTIENLREAYKIDFQVIKQGENIFYLPTLST